MSADVERALQAGRPDQALRLLDGLLADRPTDLGLLGLRLRALAAVGQFELATDLAQLVLERDPGNADASSTLRSLEGAMAPPPFGPTDPSRRSYRSELPGSMLRRLQQALHHQTYRGVQMVKNPFDVLLYQQLVWRLRPRTLIEIGSKRGGSALLFGDLIESFGIDGHVWSLDLVPVTGVEHPRVTFEHGNGRELEATLTAERLATMPRPWLVVEDADHTCETTLATLRFFDLHLRPGDWILVEDGNLSDIYPSLYPDATSGPHRALREFLRERGDRYRLAAELCDLYAYNGTTCSNGILERRGPGSADRAGAVLSGADEQP
jgi:cephalosporin hydroxylase